MHLIWPTVEFSSWGIRGTSIPKRWITRLGGVRYWEVSLGARQETKLRAGQSVPIPSRLLNKQKMLDAANYSPNNAESLAVRHILSHSTREGSVFRKSLKKIRQLTCFSKVFLNTLSNKSLSNISRDMVIQ